MTDPRQEAAALIPMIERVQRLEQLILIMRDALQQTVTAYDGFKDAASLEPLVKAMRNARNALAVVERAVELSGR